MSSSQCKNPALALPLERLAVALATALGAFSTEGPLSSCWVFGLWSTQKVRLPSSLGLPRSETSQGSLPRLPPCPSVHWNGPGQSLERQGHPPAQRMEGGGRP